jgi:hypothetical protein
MLRIFTPQTTLRENTQPYRFWGLKIFTPLTLRFQDFQRMPTTVNVLIFVACCNSPREFD